MVLPDDLDEEPARQPGPLRFTRMAGSSIAASDAAPWITDFLDAAYYRRDACERDVDDLRLAFCILTTAWYRKDPRHRLRFTDVGPFNRAFGAARLSAGDVERGQLSREQLLAGGARLFGDWFPGAYADDARRAWGIGFETVDERDAYEPERRLQLARLGGPAPAAAPPSEQAWRTYPAVEMPSAEAAIGALTRPETWPDYATELGRFTPLRRGGLIGQTFEIEVAAGARSGRPAFTRGYVTATTVVTADEPDALARWFAALEEARAVPEDGTPLLGLHLMPHRGHFMGSSDYRLLVFEHDGRPWLRAVGTWDPLAPAFRTAGRDAQHALWGEGDIEELSMLHQLARRMER